MLLNKGLRVNTQFIKLAITDRMGLLMIIVLT